MTEPKLSFERRMEIATKSECPVFLRSKLDSVGMCSGWNERS